MNQFLQAISNPKKKKKNLQQFIFISTCIEETYETVFLPDSHDSATFPAESSNWNDQLVVEDKKWIQELLQKQGFFDEMKVIR